MSSGAYKLLGFAVWQGGKRYLRRRLPSTRTVILSGALLGVGVAALGALAKRSD